PTYGWRGPVGGGGVPRAAVAWGELAGTPTVFGLPLRHVLPVSPLLLNTLAPLAAAWASTESMDCASARLVWSSHWDHELLMTVTPSLIMALNSCWKLVLIGA